MPKNSLTANDIKRAADNAISMIRVLRSIAPVAADMDAAKPRHKPEIFRVPASDTFLGTDKAKGEGECQ
jgi:hypothetical protein